MHFFRKKFFSNKLYLSILLCSILIHFSSNSFALIVHDKLWLALNAQQTLDKNKLWRSFIYSQLRFVNETHAWQSIVIEGGVGYFIASDNSIWMGYRWTGKDPYNGFSQENRLFQQIILQRPSEKFRFVFRTRLEEISPTTTSQVGLRLRQRFAAESSRAVFSQIFPVVYDEVYFQLNHPDFMPHTFLGVNRIFLGFNLRYSQNAWWEIGYINQYRIRNPEQKENEMSHIISITYNFK